MHLFYQPVINTGTFALDPSESTHCTRVLRLNAGDTIHLTDGQGKLFLAKIVNPDKKASQIQITGVSHIPRERDYFLQIALAPTKKIERFEWFIEKATEIGIDRIIPLICFNSERRVIKEDRLRKIAVAAMKQSLKAWLPEITCALSFRELVEQEQGLNKFIATADIPEGKHLANMYRKGSNVLILIGPEGDFHKDEMDMARSEGFIPANLGKSKLRTETAGLVACHTVNLVNATQKY